MISEQKLAQLELQVARLGGDVRILQQNDKDDVEPIWEAPENPYRGPWRVGAREGLLTIDEGVIMGGIHLVSYVPNLEYDGLTTVDVSEEDDGDYYLLLAIGCDADLSDAGGIEITGVGRGFILVPKADIQEYGYIYSATGDSVAYRNLASVTITDGNATRIKQRQYGDIVVHQTVSGYGCVADCTMVTKETDTHEGITYVKNVELNSDTTP